MANNRPVYGISQPLRNMFPAPIVSTRAPLATDKSYPIGQEWVNKNANTAYVLTSVAANVATWQEITNAGGGGAIAGTSLVITPGPTALTGQFTVTSGAGLPVSIGADATDHNVTIGSQTGVSALLLQSGTGDISLSPSNTGDVFIGTTTQTAASAIVVGRSTLGQPISIGGAVNTIAQSVSIASGASAANSTVNILTGVATAGTQTFNVLTGLLSQAGAANIATGTAAHVVSIGSVTGAAATTIRAGTGGLALNAAGIVSMAPATDTQASPSATAVIHARVGKATFTGFTTAAAAVETFTITNSIVTAASGILVTAHNEGANDAKMTVSRVLCGAGTFDVILTNNGAAALNGNVVITFWVID